MTNRFQSLIDGMTESVLADLAELYPHLSTDVHWYIKDGVLRGSQGQHDEEFVFEKGDPDSEAFVLILNNMPKMIQAFVRSKDEQIHS